MVALQEELDWLCYRLYGLLDADDPAVGTPETGRSVPGLSLGERPFEIVLARQGGGGGGADVLVRAARLDADHRDPRALARGVPQDSSSGGSSGSRRDPNIGLIERPEYKRRWNREPWDEAGGAGLAGLAARPPGVGPLLARPDARRRPS